ncbi:MAG: hypothetical protein LBP30_02060 [Clostridiales Family XIII bacterium]|jgi:hypothetical protein|nr:hypothetical protein [Clostridiales Family XIII bacterium]
MRRILLFLILAVFLLPYSAYAESILVPNTVVSADNELAISIVTLIYSGDKVTVEFGFSNNSGHKYRFGWVGGSYVFVETDEGKYAHEIGSFENFYTNGSDDNEIDMYDSMSEFTINGVKGAIESISIEGILPLDLRGLPISTSVGAHRILDPVVFEISSPGDVMAEPKHESNESGTSSDMATMIIPTPDTYVLTVENGTGSGKYEEGAVIQITASVPEGRKFERWESVLGDGSFVNEKSERTTYVMPASNATIKIATARSVTLEQVFPVIVPILGGFVTLFVAVIWYVINKSAKAAIDTPSRENAEKLISKLNIVKLPTPNNESRRTLENAYFEIVKNKEIPLEIVEKLRKELLKKSCNVNFASDVKMRAKTQKPKPDECAVDIGNIENQNLEQDVTFFDYMFADTSAVIHSEANRFWHVAELLLKDNRKKILILPAVMKELERFAKKPNSERRETFNAPMALSKLRELERNGVIEIPDEIRGSGVNFKDFDIRGDHADVALKVTCTALCGRFNVLTITQDNNLAYDLRELNNAKSDMPINGQKRKFSVAKKIQFDNGRLKTDYKIRD